MICLGGTDIHDTFIGDKLNQTTTFSGDNWAKHMRLMGTEF